MKQLLGLACAICNRELATDERDTIPGGWMTRLNAARRWRRADHRPGEGSQAAHRSGDGVSTCCLTCMECMSQSHQAAELQERHPQWRIWRSDGPHGSWYATRRRALTLSRVYGGERQTVDASTLEKLALALDEQAHLEVEA